MKLQNYIKKQGISKMEAARQLDITIRHLYNAIDCRVGKKTALKIQAWSGGKVKAVKLMGM